MTLTNTYNATNTTMQNLTMPPRHERPPLTSHSCLARSLSATC